MRLSWNEIRARAAAFVRKWAGEGYEKGQTQLFYRDLFDVFGVAVRKVATFEEPVKNLGDRRGYIDLFWKGVLLVEQKSMGRDLKKAKTQALGYFPGLRDSDLPRYILLSDFQSFELHDLDTGEQAAFALADLPANIERFGFIMGVQRRAFADQAPVNIEASERVGRLHDALKGGGYTGHDLERFLVRTVFCLFADDTGIFERDIFYELIAQRTRDDGSDCGPWLAKLFEVLNTPEDARSARLDADLARFPYINGDLFAGPLRIPDFDAELRRRLLDACAFDWSAISPAIFGALFQSVMNPDERRATGAHYTTEKNILKVIGPLFLDDLHAEFDRLKRRLRGRRAALERFHDRLAALTFFDPACGCGNFLVIAYRELRQLEIEVLREIHADDLHRFKGGATELPVQSFVKLDVDRFYGIEIGEFAARIAETALWMMDHQMNNELSLAFGQAFARIPLRRAPHILHADALEEDWAALLPPERCSYLFGNPPFVGAKYQSVEQREQVRRIAGLGGAGGTLDFVAAWFILGARYVRAGGARLGFVATNSITQGEQVAQLWPLLLDHCRMEIAFAHRTFAWGSDARGMAHVHVVILGLDRADNVPPGRRLFSYPDVKGDPVESRHAALSPYLFDAGALGNPHLVVREAPRPLNGWPRIIIGSKPIDGGYFILDAGERAALLAAEPGAAPFVRPFIGAREFLQGGERWILALQDAPPQVLRGLPRVREIIRQVRAFRLGEIPPKRKPDATPKPPGISARALAETPTRYHVNVIPDAPFLVVPRVSSERREYVPIGWADPPTVASDAVFVLQGATRPLFALLTSAMHMAWLRHMGGRLKSDYRYSIGLVYNTFPPPPPGADTDVLAPLAEAVLAARAAHPGASLADLYDPDLMPAGLRRAHAALDRAVDRLYARRALGSDRERAEFLLARYEAMTAPLTAAPKPRRRR